MQDDWNEIEGDNRNIYCDPLPSIWCPSLCAVPEQNGPETVQCEYTTTAVDHNEQLEIVHNHEDLNHEEEGVYSNVVDIEGTITDTTPQSRQWEMQNDNLTDQHECENSTRLSVLNHEDNATCQTGDNNDLDYWNEFDDGNNELLRNDGSNLTYLENQIDDINNDVEGTDNTADMLDNAGMAMYDNAENYLLEYWDNFAEV